MMTRKRYRQKLAETLLASVVEIAQAPIEKQADAVHARNVLAQVLLWGGFSGGSSQSIEALRTWPSVDFQRWREEFDVFVRFNVRRTKEQPAPLVKIGPLHMGPVPGKRTVELAVFGALRDVLWFQLLQLTCSSGFDRLLRCECGKVFVKVGRREFCSERCQKRVYMRKQRHPEGEGKQKEAARGKKTRTR